MKSTTPSSFTRDTAQTRAPRSCASLFAAATLASALLVTGLGASPALATPEMPGVPPAGTAAPAPGAPAAEVRAPEVDPEQLLPRASAMTSAAAAALPAGTLVYIQNYNVWAARSDGTGAYQITQDGSAAAPYENPSMSDAGLVVAQHAGKLSVLRTNGALVTQMKPTLFGTSNCTVVVPPGPPLRPRISPDGTKIAFHQTRGVNCGSGVRVESLSGIVHTATGGFASSILLGPSPSWVTNTRVVLRYISLADPGEGAVANHWFADNDVLNTDDYGFFRDVTEPAVSRSGNRVGFILSNFNQAFILPTPNDPRTGAPAKPQRGTGCVYTGDAGTNTSTPQVESLSFSADGSATYVRDGANIVAISVPIDNCAAGTVTRVVANASDPFWSPAGFTAPVKSPFVDVPTTHKFFTEIAWMHSSGLSTGTRTDRGLEYRPAAGMDRTAMAAFMFRAAAPANFVPPVRSPFVDVPTSHKFYKEIAWMHSSGLSTGTRTDQGLVYRPAGGMDRASMAAFMYRAR